MDTAIILAGGKSTRMGLDKQFLVLENQWMMDQIIKQLEKLFKEIIIVTNKPEEYKDCPYTIVQDQIKDFGPVGGIHAGLKSSSSLYNYIIACDMPFININYIQYMKRLINTSSKNVDAVVAMLGEWIEPFNGFYSKRLIEKIEKNIQENKKMIISILKGSNVLYIEEKKARIFSPGWEMFINLNSPKDLKEYLACKNGGELDGCYK